jgi:hypothetical protein
MTLRGEEEKRTQCESDLDSVRLLCMPPEFCAFLVRATPILCVFFALRARLPDKRTQ